jgi:HJR/Mrr/RecB family endonuclease
MLEITSELSGTGYVLNICEKRSGLFGTRLAVQSEWDDALEKLPPLKAAVLDELKYQGRLKHIDEATRLLTFEHAASLANDDALQLGLLPPFPYQIDIQSVGGLASDDFRISYSATNGGVRVAGTFSEGIFQARGKWFRISGAIYWILRRANELNSAHSRNEKIAAFAALRLLLPDDASVPNINTDAFIMKVRVSHITAFSLKPILGDGDINFDPIPMRRSDTEMQDGAKAELAVTPATAELFGKQFRLQKHVNSTYAIESGQYIFIDPSLRPALEVVKRKQSAPIHERVSFLMAPAATISAAYKESDDDRDVSIGDTLFYETDQYSERIVGLGEWIPPQLSYLEKQSNIWLPERFSVILGDKLVVGEVEDVPEWLRAVQDAISRGHQQVELGDISISTNAPGLVATLQRLMPPEAPPDKELTFSDREQEQYTSARPRIAVLKTRENFDEAEFKRQFIPRQLNDANPPLMKVELKQHQQQGVAWLVGAYTSGWPGVLLADDMGLGKTLQSLTFLMLLMRERLVRSGRPALVVAPTSLLKNWESEHQKFAFDEGLGPPLIAFGSQLSALKIGKTNDGLMLLDSQEIKRATWVLTTFETVRDYHVSFAGVPFSVGVFDEIQKAKNPTTRINAALKTLNIDFVLGMTGTPVENSIADLWAITDIIAPGYFPPLREFMKIYGKSQAEAERAKSLERLSNEILSPSTVSSKAVPAYALRRMKEDVAKDLPAKHEGNMVRTAMPTLQASRYAEISAATQAGNLKILRALHDFRSISLHPADPESVSGGLVSAEDYIMMSARFAPAFQQLTLIASRKEKVIIFVNSRKIQTILSRLIRERFACPQPEFIRGDTNPSQRQPIVDRFSEVKGFAALILSPRAAGVGLNIVAANHVIHLDRWWNPAVEDQCTDRAYRIGAKKEVYVYKFGAVHPQLQETSYDVILDELLTSRRAVSRKILTSTEITAADFAQAFQSRSPLNLTKILEEVDKSGPLALEEFVRDCLVRNGLNAKLTIRSGDGGADIVVRDELGTISHLLQCKHVSNIDVPVDNGLLIDAERVRENWHAADAIVVGVTNGKRFSQRVADKFSKNGWKLIARDQLPELTLP